MSRTNGRVNVSIEDIEKTIIAKELEERSRLIPMKNNLWEYAKEHDHEFFHDGKNILSEIAGKIQLAYEGKIKKLGISLYPRSGKSYLISLACAWALGNSPSGCIMRNAYGDNLANKFSYDIMAMINSKLFRTVFEGVKLSKKKKSVDAWALNTSKQFAYFGSGVGGTTTGFGCNVLGIVDDPVKNMTDALSPKVLESVWDWFFSTHRTRFEVNSSTKEMCPEVIISTMWSKDDLINRIIETEGKKEEGGDWEFVSYPALDENDKSTCEDMMPTNILLKKREECYKANEGFIWETMFQNTVVQKFGNMFPKDSLMFVDEELFPTEYDAVIGWLDPADKGKNYTCSAIVGISNGLAYVIDVIFIKKGYEHYKQLVIDQIIKYLPSMYVIESNKDGRIIAVEIRKSVAELLEKMKDEEEYKATVFDISIVTKNESKNKELRISLNASTIKSMFVFMRKKINNVFYTAFIKNLTEYLSEGNNPIDDAPDTLSGIASIVKPKGSSSVEVLNGN